MPHVLFFIAAGNINGGSGGGGSSGDGSRSKGISVLPIVLATVLPAVAVVAAACAVYYVHRKRRISQELSDLLNVDPYEREVV